MTFIRIIERLKIATNRRTDPYGGSLENRLTLALNLIRMGREARGGFILGFHIS